MDFLAATTSSNTWSPFIANCHVKLADPYPSSCSSQLSVAIVSLFIFDVCLLFYLFFCFQQSTYLYLILYPLATHHGAREDNQACFHPASPPPDTTGLSHIHIRPLIGSLCLLDLLLFCWEKKDTSYRPRGIFFFFTGFRKGHVIEKCEIFGVAPSSKLSWIGCEYFI